MAASRQRPGVEQHADARRRAAADPAAQLVQLRQAEALGVLDHHQRGVRHVDADLDHRGGDQHRDLAAGEERHHRRLLGRRHAAVDQADHPAGQRVAELAVRLGGVLQVERLRLLDQRADPVDLPAARHLVADPVDHLVALAVGEEPRHDRRAARRQLVDRADVEVGEQRHRQRARNRRRAHHQHVRLERIASPSFSASLPRNARRCVTPKRCCSSTIARPSRAKRDLLLDHRVGADDQRGLARGHLLEHLRARLALAAAGQPGDA